MINWRNCQNQLNPLSKLRKLNFFYFCLYNTSNQKILTSQSFSCSSTNQTTLKVLAFHPPNRNSNKMFVLYKISQQISVTPQQYRLSLSKATKTKIFQKYLYKICFNGICVKINRIEIIDNLILRKDAEILVILEVELLLAKFIEDQYFQGTVKEYDQNGIIINFMNGLLEGKILPSYLHEKTIYNFAQKKQPQNQNPEPQNDPSNQNPNSKQNQLIGKWILPYDSKKAFTWKLNEKVKFKIQATNFQLTNQKRFADLIFLKADEEGLGPASWWI